MYYTYVLIDVRDGKPFYVGKGKGKRMYNHGKKITPNPYLYRKIQNIKSLGLDIIYEKWFEGDEEFCFWMEIYLVSELGRDTLCNLTDGGEDPPKITKENYPDICKKKSEAWKGDKNPRSINKPIGDKNPFYGKKHSKETIQKNREHNIGKIGANKGKEFSQEWKNNLSKSHMGHTPWNKGKKCPNISENMKGNKNGKKKIE